MKIPTKGAFGRPARYRHGPSAVLRTAHPASLEFLQLPSPEHKYNLLQYFFSGGVRAVRVDRQLPIWVTAFVPKRAAPFTQVVEFGSGDLLIVRLRRGWEESEPVVANLRPHIWYVERTTLDVSLPVILNRNLELLTQAHVMHHDLALTAETAELARALRLASTTTFGDLKAYAAIRLGLDEHVTQVIIARLFLARQIGACLAAVPLRDETVIRWGVPGVGHIPPMPRFGGMHEEDVA
jgi:hypothetical protein